MQSNCLMAVANSSTQAFPTRSNQRLLESLPLSDCEVCVIVPVRDEAAVLETTLAALANQVDLLQRPLDFSRYEVIVFANNCSDDSAAIARRFARQHPDFVLHVLEQNLPENEAYIGRVRQLLMDEAYARFIQQGKAKGIIASTDGDTQVDPTWIAATLQEIANGTDAVGGRIITDRESRNALDHHARAYYLRSVGYHALLAELESYLDPNPHDPCFRHYQHFGASFAVTAEAYALAGGMPAVRTPEDVAFYQALLRVDARFRHSSRVRVTTSARQVSRTNLGFANQLTQWSQMGQKQQPFWVESISAHEARLQARRQLRVLWYRLGDRPDIATLMAIANPLGISSEWLNQELEQFQPFGLLWERIEQRQQEEGNWQQRYALVKIEQAIADLRLRLYKLRRENLSAAASITAFQTNPADISPHCDPANAAS